MISIEVVNRLRAARGEAPLNQNPGPVIQQRASYVPPVAPTASSIPTLSKAQVANRSPTPDFLNQYTGNATNQNNNPAYLASIAAGGSAAQNQIIQKQPLPDNYTVQNNASNTVGSGGQALQSVPGDLSQVANLHGITSQNIFDKLGGTITDFHGGNQGGGNDFVLAAMLSPDLSGSEVNSFRQTGRYDETQQGYLEQFIRSGVAPPELDPAYTAAAYTQSLALSAQRVHDAQNPTSAIGRFVKTALPAIAGALIGGPVFGAVTAGMGAGGAALATAATAAKIGGAAGAAINSGAQGNSLLNVGLDALGGYGMGGTVHGLTSGSLLNGAKDYLFGKDYVNPSALGGSLQTPGLSNAPGAANVTQGASALGLNGAQLGLNFASDAITGGFPAIAPATNGLLDGTQIGLNFESMPGAFPGVTPAGSSWTDNIGNSASGGNFNPAGGFTQTNQSPTNALAIGGSLAGSALAPNNSNQFNAMQTSTLEPVSGSFPQAGSNPVTDRFNYALTDALTGSKGNTKGQNGQNSLGSGLIAPSQRDLQRNPGYQPRPFANYLMRG